jgi:transposase
MKVINYEVEIQESVEKLRAVEKQQTKAKLLRRVQLLRMLKSGEFTESKKAAQFLGYSSKQGYQLWKKYKAEGLSGYLELKYQANHKKLNCEQEEYLLKKAEEGFSSQKEVRELILEKFGVSYTQQGISDLFQRLKIKKKVPRPFNLKADKEVQAEYKKSLR